MSPTCQKVLNALENAANRGVTVSDFPTGFRLAARIKDLRDMNYQILTDPQPDKMARYVLMGKS